MSGSPILERLYDEHADAVFGFLLHLSGSEADARDLLQDVFLKLVRKPGLLGSVHHIRAFLLRMAHHAFVDSIRRRQTRERSALALGEASCWFAHQHPPGMEQDWGPEVSRAMTQIPAEQRAVLHLKLWQERTFAEIGQILGISTHTAASRYRYALNKMEALLRPHYEQRHD
ncbi:MAG: RNA polymerase sigma factor [Blastochloris sp.]|nr:RNA polymerase sigma factor [Blastochloris sp.]